MNSLTSLGMDVREYITGTEPLRTVMSVSILKELQSILVLLATEDTYRQKTMTDAEKNNFMLNSYMDFVSYVSANTQHESLKPILQSEEQESSIF